MITEYDRFSEEEDNENKLEIPDALRAQQEDISLISNADDLSAVQMNMEKKALHQITTGEAGDGEDTSLAANVGFENQFQVNGGTDLEANNNVDP